MTTLSICCIDTVNHAQAASSVIKTLNSLPDSFTHICIRWVSDKPFGYTTSVPVHWHRIPEIQIFPLDYNRITLELLPRLIQEDFVLIVQADGHAIHAHAWSDEFLKYDYIGPPFNPHWLPDDTWAVGNGGFSLRSAKLMQSLMHLNVQASARGEDVIICWDLRHRLEQEYQIKFAPLEVANQFAQDLNLNLKFGPSPNLAWLGKSFGFHGMHEAQTHYGPLAGSILPGHTERTHALKIAVYTIALNEEQFVDTWFESVKEADYWLVADTGSTDQTVSQLRHRGVKCEAIHVHPWRFDLARNIALSLIPADVDVCISMDMDEHMAPGWRPILEAAWQPGTTRVRHTYHTHYSGSEHASLSHMADKIHARHGYTWNRPVHETVMPVNGEHVVTVPDLVQLHMPDAHKTRSQYLDLLKLSHAENPSCAQTLFWLAREHAHVAEHEPAVQHFLKLLGMDHVWHLERSEAERWLAKLQPHRALEWLRRSVASAPERRETWRDLAQHYYHHAEWASCYAACVQALKITHKTGSYLDTLDVWGSHVPDLAAVSAWNLGLREQSLSYAEQAVQLNPQDDRLKNNLSVIQQTLGKV